MEQAVFVALRYVNVALQPHTTPAALRVLHRKVALTAVPRLQCVRLLLHPAPSRMALANVSSGVRDGRGAAGVEARHSLGAPCVPRFTFLAGD